MIIAFLGTQSTLYTGRADFTPPTPGFNRSRMTIIHAMIPKDIDLSSAYDWVF